MDVISLGSDPIIVDIVFVHGLGGNPILTWQKNDTVWPRDLLPRDAMQARIMTFAYETDVSQFFGAWNDSGIIQHALNLLQDLQRERQTHDEKQRPIIFVGHSLGGLVIKDALCRAFEYSNQRRHKRAAAIFNATAGVVFLGTPHRGSNRAAWATVAKKLNEAVFKIDDPRVVEALTRGSEVLERLQDSFSGLLHSISVYSFMENMPVEGIGKVVDDDSATIGHPDEVRQWLHADHLAMCRFDGRDSVAYRRVTGAIVELINDTLDPLAEIKIHVPRSPLPPRQTLDRPLASTPSSSSSLKHPVARDRAASPELPTATDPPARPELPTATDAAANPRRPTAFDCAAGTGRPDTAASEAAAPALRLPSSLPQLRPLPQVKRDAVQTAPKSFLRGMDLDEIRRCVDGQADINAVNGGSGTALQMASERGYSETVKWLIAHGADVNVQAGRYDCALSAAAAEGHDDVVRILLDAGAKLDIIGVDEWSALRYACEHGHCKVVRRLLQAGADVSAFNHRGLTPLSEAVTNGHFEVVKILIDWGAEMLATHFDRQTPLHTAASYGHSEVARFLIDQGADILAVDVFGETPLHRAALGGHLEVVKLLIDKGADISEADQEGCTPLFQAAYKDHFEVVKLLIDRGADIAVADRYGYTPLYIAAFYGHIEVVKLLTEQGADISAAVVQYLSDRAPKVPKASGSRRKVSASQYAGVLDRDLADLFAKDSIRSRKDPALRMEVAVRKG